MRVASFPFFAVESDFSLTPHSVPLGQQTTNVYHAEHRAAQLPFAEQATSETDVLLPSSLPNGHCAG